jgi:hypothetical protein
MLTIGIAPTSYFVDQIRAGIQSSFNLECLPRLI